MTRKNRQSLSNTTSHQKSWVLVADSARARLFSTATPAAPLVEVEDMLNPSARLREHELDSDRSGRLAGGLRDNHGGGNVAARHDNARHEHDRLQFGRAICSRLKDLHLDGKLMRLYVIAEPGFLGVLRQCMPDSVQNLVVQAVDKNLTTAKSTDIRETLPTYL